MITVIVLLALVAAFAALADYARHDRFAGPQDPHVQHDAHTPAGEHYAVRP